MDRTHGILIPNDDSLAGERAVGRGLLPWYRELFHHHPSEELVTRVNDLAIWGIR